MALTMSEQTKHITFLIASGPLAANKDAFVFTTLMQAYRDGAIIGCLCPDTDYSDYLDDWLWSYQPEHFLPHTQTIASKKTKQIYIHHQLTALDECTQILNLTSRALTSFVANCVHLELVHAQNKQQQRQTFRDYQQIGIQPQTRNIH